ncbi:ResB protein required for cytochrome c biosynthesis [Intrasporangium oryzae NRRL B-24470]|uniref:ResB protein required for cytochrome c biosynthesis n=1 Tax=Intrasporangium oryzae NRRL B-24470 TaxID=1386089 RepID=W9G1D4_9MICO|nr:cytochrome c biogenesis protein ResB [Intrasporangium oryzae]EWS99905.1 ResB protein required for cytochrome c biosynthesis [Intrasporangium oryzae NRRL B-24470]
MSTDLRAPRTAPPEPALPRLGPVGLLRWAWRQLTSMRTALFLLLLLSVAAVPGSIFPQRNIDAGRVADYMAQNPTTSPWLDRFGFFDVYSSPWFSAIYLLLFISLIGCIVPRTKVHVAALRSTPPRAPARLHRLPEHAEVTTTLSPEEALAEARTVLKAKRFRLHAHDATSVSGESGYLRETGNLVFHLALTGIIVGMAVGHLLGWRGDVILAEGDRFASSAGTYNTISPGPWVDDESLPPFVLGLERLDVQFNETPGRGFGMPREFTAYTSLQESPGAPVTRQAVSVNHPLTVGGADIFLLGNGYAPVITVRDAKGTVLYRESTPFLAQDGNYRSVGVIKVPSAQPKQLGITGFFLPTAEPTFANGPVSLFPDAKNPEVALSIWEGNLFPGGAPQSVYTLNTEEMKQVTKADGSPALVRLKPGQTYEMPGGRGSITLERVKRFAGLSVRTDPGAPISLVSAILATLGLILGLVIKRRRVFVRVRREPTAPDAGAGPPVTVVSIGGLSKDSDAGLAAIVQAVHDHLAERKDRP